MAFADARSRRVLEAGQVLASLSLDPEQRSQKQVFARLNLCWRLPAMKVSVAVLNPQLQVDQEAPIPWRLSLARQDSQPVRLEVVAARDGDSLDPLP